MNGAVDEIERALEALFDPGGVVELRAFRDRETVSGYFDDHAALAREAAELDRRGYAVYVTLNEIHAALLSRASNRARSVYKEPTTADADIVRRRYLPVDLDPVRPAGVSSTKEEKRVALLRAREIRDHLRDRGWPDPVVGDSGNGAHLLYRVDLPNDRESAELVKGVIAALAFAFDDGAVKVDTGVHNAARIWKLYGVVSCKGDSTAERPHRTSRLLKVPEEGTI